MVSTINSQESTINASLETLIFTMDFQIQSPFPTIKKVLLKYDNILNRVKESLLTETHMAVTYGTIVAIVLKVITSVF